jgi:hypothetical protein
MIGSCGSSEDGARRVHSPIPRRLAGGGAGPGRRGTPLGTPRRVGEACSSIQLGCTFPPTTVAGRRSGSAAGHRDSSGAPASRHVSRRACRAPRHPPVIRQPMGAREHRANRSTTARHDGRVARTGRRPQGFGRASRGRRVAGDRSLCKRFVRPALTRTSTSGRELRPRQHHQDPGPEVGHVAERGTSPTPRRRVAGAGEPPPPRPWPAPTGASADKRTIPQSPWASTAGDRASIPGRGLPVVDGRLAVDEEGDRASGLEREREVDDRRLVVERRRIG